MKKAVITIIGTIGGSCDKENPKKGIFKSNNAAIYKSEIAEIANTEDVNSLPILIQSFHEAYEIISLYTPCAKDIQNEVLRRHKDPTVQAYSFDPAWELDDNLDYDTVFSKIDTLLNQYDKVIIDVSHGYRHLPILMIINAVMHNIESIDKIERILYAKQIIAFKEYEFIDLKRYLDLANISYALTTFDRNYTVANNVKVSDMVLNSFLEELSQFSKHILANSLDGLLKDTNKRSSIATQLINQIDLLSQQDNTTIFRHLNRLLQKTKDHITTVKAFEQRLPYEKIYLLSDNMYKKGYLLNSITLLSEAIGMYLAESYKRIDSDIDTMITTFEKKANSEKNNERTYYKLYTLYNQSKALYSAYQYRGVFLQIDARHVKSESMKEKLMTWNNEISRHTATLKKQEKDEEIKQLIREIDAIRNNLAHANSSKRLSDVENNIKTVLQSFSTLCIDENRLKVKTLNA